MRPGATALLVAGGTGAGISRRSRSGEPFLGAGAGLESAWMLAATRRAWTGSSGEGDIAERNASKDGRSHEATSMVPDWATIAGDGLPAGKLTGRVSGGSTVMSMLAGDMANV